MARWWPWGIEHVVIASGDDRAAADPLTAAGICWAYDAPLLLVSESHTPTSVKRAIKEITDDHAPVHIHVVGGPVSVPYERYQDIVDYVGNPALLTFDRVAPHADRYELAESIATRMKLVSDTTPKDMTDIMLVANGADSEKFFDALALSPITAISGSPILLVAQDSVPGSTRDAVALLTPTRTIVGGGPATVDDSVVAELGAERWWGSDRYTTAAAIASRAVAEGALDDDFIGVAAKLPDALTGGAMVGLRRGPLLLTQTDRVPSATRNFIAARAPNTQVLVFGGPVSITEDVREDLWLMTR
jgi:putative cell wall-binding protein